MMCVQSHWRHHWEEYYQEIKSARNLVASLIAGCKPVARGSLLPGRWLAMNVSGSKVRLKGVPTREPVFNLDATWIDEAEKKTAEINGFGGGYQGEGSKTVLPAEAFFKVSFRLVHNQKPDRILALAARHFEKNRPSGIRIDITNGHGGEPFAFDPTTAQGLAARRALEETFGRPPALTREGGSIPILTDFQKILGHPALLLALASPDCRAHAPNESFPIANFLAGIRLNQALLRELATAGL
jgi:acetylornithine deacetylase/succinyl-diaminopimelate desuccinylase-like protein